MIPEKFISVDPGERCYYAWWCDGKLRSCGNYWKILYHNIDQDTRGRVLGPLRIEDQVVRRNKTIVKNGRRIHVNIDPSATITLAQYAGAVARDWGYPEPGWEEWVKWVKPESWKGQSKKPALARDVDGYVIARLNYEALSEIERGTYCNARVNITSAKEKMDLDDAVGLGLAELGRLKW